MSLPMNFNRVFSGFRRSVLIELTVGDHVDGVWQETLVPVDQGEPAPPPPEEDPIDPDFMVSASCLSEENSGYRADGHHRTAAVLR